MLWAAASTARRKSAPRPDRRSSYQFTAWDNSSSASGSNLTERLTSRRGRSRFAAEPRPKARHETHRSGLGWNVARFRPPTSDRLPPGNQTRDHRNSQGVRQQARRDRRQRVPTPRSAGFVRHCQSAHRNAAPTKSTSRTGQRHACTESKRTGQPRRQSVPDSQQFRPGGSNRRTTPAFQDQAKRPIPRPLNHLDQGEPNPEIMQCPSTPTRRPTSHDMWVILGPVLCLAAGLMVGGS